MQSEYSHSLLSLQKCAWGQDFCQIEADAKGFDVTGVKTTPFARQSLSPQSVVERIRQTAFRWSAFAAIKISSCHTALVHIIQEFSLVCERRPCESLNTCSAGRAAFNRLPLHNSPRTLCGALFPHLSLRFFSCLREAIEVSGVTYESRSINRIGQQ